MKLIITYKNGNTIESEAYYVHVESGKLFYSVKHGNISVAPQAPVSIPMENVDKFDVTEE